MSSILICLEIALIVATLVVMLSVSTGTGFQLQDEVNSNSVDKGNVSRDDLTLSIKGHIIANKRDRRPSTTACPACWAIGTN